MQRSRRHRDEEDKHGDILREFAGNILGRSTDTGFQQAFISAVHHDISALASEDQIPRRDTVLNISTQLSEVSELSVDLLCERN